MSNDTNSIQGVRFWWIQVLRGIFAIGLGLSLWGSLVGISLLSENFASKDQVLLFIGMFWLTTGLMSFIWGTKVAKDPGYWWIGAMVIGIGGGIFVILRTIIDDYIGIFAAKNVIALFFFLNGSMNILDVHKNPEDSPRWKMRKSPARLSFFMGLVEAVVAITMILFWDLSVFIDTFISVLAILWAMIGGIGLLYRGVKLRKIWQIQKLNQ